MEFFILALAVVSFTLVGVKGIKKCEKIDACRCSTDEGEINLWSLAGQTSNQPRFNIEDATPPDIPSRTKDLYQWNPCSPWTAQSLPNETVENHCKEVAVCLTQKIDGFGTLRKNIGEQKLSDCVFDQDSGRCVLTYGVTSDEHIRTKIFLVCNETEEGRVDPMNRFFSSLRLYYTSLYSKCACPGKCSGLSTGAIVGIVAGSVAALLLLAFAVFVCCLRRRLPSGAPKPSMCTMIKVGFGIITDKCCPCCRSHQYSFIPGESVVNQ